MLKIDDDDDDDYGDDDDDDDNDDYDVFFIPRVLNTFGTRVANKL